MRDAVLHLPGRTITTAVEEAIFLVFGGLRDAAAALGVGTPTLHAVINKGYVRTRSNAERWERATAQHGCRVPREELIGWAPWRGPERHAGLPKVDPPSPDRKRPGRVPRARSAAPLPTAAARSAAAVGGLRGASIARPVGARSEAQETAVASSAPNTPSYAHSNPAFVYEAAGLVAVVAVPAAVGNHFRHSGPRRRCTRRSKSAISYALVVQSPAFRCLDEAA